MGTKEKLLDRFKQQPKDFTWNELVRLFALMGFELRNKGKTSGSRAIFAKGEYTFAVHKPHLGNTVQGYVMKQVAEYFRKLDLLD